MENQELIDFVQRRTLEGATKEQIEADLQNGGGFVFLDGAWTEKESANIIKEQMGEYSDFFPNDGTTSKQNYF